MAKNTFPSKLERLSPAIVTALLREQRPGVLVKAVEVLESARRGDGLASTADRVALERHGVHSPPRPDEAWLRYRQAAIWGLVIGWLIAPTENYGEAITVANISRLVAAVQDLETLRALG